MDAAANSSFLELMERFGARPAAAPRSRDAGFVELGPRFEAALLYAAAAHREQPRKGTPVPYLSHLLGVASIVLTHGGNEDQAIAALLHDTVEDCGTEHEPVIGELFGGEVLRIVLACTDSRVRAGGERTSWRERKEQYLQHLRERPEGDAALLVSCSDKVHNAQAIVADLEEHGLELWDRFPGKTPEDNLWYYDSLAEIFEDLLPGRLSGHLRRAAEAMRSLHRDLIASPSADA